ncbi:nuclear transport factor 2 family protein [Actinoplanes sp. NPDC049599]|uniref:nuclear transport factor 2 family protein n=1 Tax=Actinoplanes sp. NPDC049599 TaxID=3363903 RepID=UPI003792D35A
MQQFRAAVEARDIAAAVALMADDVVFHSPIAFTPYRGREAVGTVLRAVLEVFEDFRYVREIGAPDAVDQALVFRTRVGERELEGCDFLQYHESGAIAELTVMVRPLNGALALAEAMKAKLAGA